MLVESRRSVDTFLTPNYSLLTSLHLHPHILTFLPYHYPVLHVMPADRADTAFDLAIAYQYFLSIYEVSRCVWL